MLKKLGKDSLEITKTGMLLGIGSKAIGEDGGNASSLTKISDKLPILGSAVGSGAVLKAIKKIK